MALGSHDHTHLGRLSIKVLQTWVCGGRREHTPGSGLSPDRSLQKLAESGDERREKGFFFLRAAAVRAREEPKRLALRETPY